MIEEPRRNEHRWGVDERSVWRNRRELILYSGSAGALHAATIMSSIVVLRWVDPALMGIWHTVILMHAYGDGLRLGVLRALNLEIPDQLGRGRDVYAGQLARTGQGYAVVTAGMGAVLLLGAAFWAGDRQWRIGLVGGALVWVCASLISYLFVTYRATNRFTTLGGIQFIQTGVCLLSLVLVVLWGFGGVGR